MMLFGLTLTVFLILCALLTVVILLQEPKQGGLGDALGGGGGADFSTSGGVAGGLHRVTIALGILWGIFALLLNIIPR
jgi:preprotein translocase subunit SecG